MANTMKVYFNEDVSPIVFDILKNTGKEETDEEFMHKLANNLPLQEDILFNAVDKIVIENIPEKVMCSFIETEMNIPTANAKIIYDEILKKLVPIALKETITKPQAEKTAKNSNLNISGSDIMVNEPIENSITETITPAPTKIKKEKISEKVKQVIPPEVQKSGPDNYREPIE